MATAKVPSWMALKLEQARNDYDIYLEWRNLYEAIKLNVVLELSPNYEVIVESLVRLGVEARENYERDLMELFGPLVSDDLVYKP